MNGAGLALVQGVNLTVCRTGVASDTGFLSMNRWLGMAGDGLLERLNFKESS